MTRHAEVEIGPASLRELAASLEWAANAAPLLRVEMDRAADDGCVRALLHLPPGWSAPPGTAWRDVRREGFVLRPACGGPDDLEGFEPYIFRPDHF